MIKINNKKQNSNNKTVRQCIKCILSAVSQGTKLFMGFEVVFFLNEQKFSMIADDMVMKNYIKNTTSQYMIIV